MYFYEVEKALRAGKKIKLEKWDKAYWCMKDGALINHDENGEECSTMLIHPAYLAVWLTSDTWQVVNEEQTPDPAAVPVPDFSFGIALDYLKAGKKVARKGWNGKGMFLVLCPGSEVPADRMRVKAVKKFYMKEEHTPVVIAPHIDLKAADGTYVTGWLASQTDMLADDWYVVE